jgi:hypothetical protein
MKIKHNALPYVLPGLLALVLVVGGASEWGDTAATVMVVCGVVVALLCVVDREVNTLAFKDGKLAGTAAFKRIVSPADKIQYCEYSGVLCFNKIKINCLTGHYEFKNMSHAKAFCDYVNGNM